MRSFSIEFSADICQDLSIARNFATSSSLSFQFSSELLQLFYRASARPKVAPKPNILARANASRAKHLGCLPFVFAGTMIKEIRNFQLDNDPGIMIWLRIRIVIGRILKTEARTRIFSSIYPFGHCQMTQHCLVRQIFLLPFYTARAFNETLLSDRRYRICQRQQECSQQSFGFAGAGSTRQQINHSD